MNPLAQRKLPASLGDFAAIARWRASTSSSDDESPIAVVVADSAELRLCAAALCALLLTKEPGVMTADEFDEDGRLDHAAWMANCEQTRDQLRELATPERDRTELLAELPAGITACVSQIRELSQSHVPALLDGPVPAAAALLAFELDPEVLDWVRPLQCGQTPTEQLAWEHLRIEPILPFKTRINDGSLADLAESVLRTAVRLAQHVTDDDRPS